MEPEGDSPPFWSPSTATILHHQRRRRRSPSSIFSPVSLIILLPILALVIIFFLVPPFLSHTTKILRPTYSVRKSWDSLNILLVVFAILCGVFASRNDDVSAAETSSDQVGFVSSDGSFNESSAQHTETSQVTRWFDASVGSPDAGADRLRRSRSSHPDLRQGLVWETGETQYRVLDDFDVNLYKQLATSDRLNPRARRSDAEKGENVIKVIPVHTFEVDSARPPFPEPPPKPQAAPPPPANLKPRQSVHSVPSRQREAKQRSDAEVAKAKLEESQSPPPANSMQRQRQRQSHQRRRIVSKDSEAEFDEIRSPRPPETQLTQRPLPPPPQPPTSVETENESRLQKEKSGTSKDAKKSNHINSSGSFSEGSPTNVHSSIPPSTPPPLPPPPPPPPSKGFQNLFKKSSRNKRVHSVSATVPPPPPPPPPPTSIFNIFRTGSKSKRFNASSSAPPPPPPPPSSILNSVFNSGSKSRLFKLERPTPPPPPPKHQTSSKRKSKYTQSQPPPPPPAKLPQRRPSATWKPLFPAKPNNYYEEYSNSGAQSPLVPLPPPPPPPFKMAEFKFVARGDFVRIVSTHISRFSSPGRADLEDRDAMSVKSSIEAVEGQDSIGPSVFCSSPDVNLKADFFIARLKDEWRLDKMNSTKGRNTPTHGAAPIAD